MVLKTYCMSNIGGRKTNDDTALVARRGENAWVFVGDGLGAYAGGKQASRAAGYALMDLSRQGSMLSRERLALGAETADAAVKEVQRQTGGTMKTTLVFLAVEGGNAQWMHVGDSRLYHFRGGRLVKQTLDHSVSQMAVLMGEITQAEIRFHEDRNRVLRALGGDTAKPDISEVTALEEGDCFLLCTDGFWEYVNETEMEKTLARAETPRDWVRSMEHILRGRVSGDNDNYTAAAVFCGEAKKPGLLSRLFRPA